MNLDFENATVELANGPGIVYASNAIPDWSAFTGPTGNPTNSSSVGSSIIGYDTISLGGAAVFIEDSNAPSGGGPLPIQGNYSLLLQGSIPAAAGTASIAQTGTIPLSAQSLTFWGRFAVNLQGQNLQLSFNNQALSFVSISNVLNYAVYGVDISPFAGQTGQFLFTVPVEGYALLDNIQFSSLPIPEPVEYALAVLGVLTLGFHFRRNRSG